MILNITPVSGPLVEPIQLDEAKNWLKVNQLVTDDDPLIRDLIKAARTYCENIGGHQLITASYLLQVDSFPIFASTQFPFPVYQTTAQNSAWAASIYQYLLTPSYGVLTPQSYNQMTFPNWGNLPFPRPPLVSVDYVKYLDSNKTLQTWSSANYAVITNTEPGYLKPLTSYPQTATVPGAVQVQFTCGYGFAENVPANIKQAMRLLLTYWYDNRGPTELGDAVEQSINSLLTQDRYWGFN